MRDKTTKQYTNDDITVVWKPGLCIHSAICWKGLNAVFNPDKWPWIMMDGATSELIAAQVDKCPSGALSWFRNDAEQEHPDTATETIVELQPNGPLLVRGDIAIRDGKGGVEHRRGVTALCRCGGSGNKPYCDGNHTKIGFKG
ncbi:MAG: (4Fe-4S)-binding protein [candidate division Zixibacteria bacterium]|nr:(4Fe-4S)-binding protein [candidate division Zixibacteria bacterium]